jgi:hypothetical protein
MTRMAQCEQRIVAVLGRARAMGEARATRTGHLARGGRGLEITKPWPDREFAGIGRMGRENDVAPDGAQWGAGGTGLASLGAQKWL